MNIVGELKEFLKDVPDHYLLGSKGHFGELLKCLDIRVQEVKKTANSNKKVMALVMIFEDAGEEPD